VETWRKMGSMLALSTAVYGQFVPVAVIPQNLEM
jgi:hypothetical protein